MYARIGFILFLFMLPFGAAMTVHVVSKPSEVVKPAAEQHAVIGGKETAYLTTEEEHPRSPTTAVEVEEPAPVPEKPDIWEGRCFMGNGFLVWFGRATAFDADNDEAYRRFTDVAKKQRIIISGPHVCIWRAEGE